MATKNQDVTWTFIKGLVDGIGIKLHFTENVDEYSIFAFNGQIIYSTAIFKNSGALLAVENQTQNDADKLDFETNYKATANALEQLAVEASFDAATSLDVHVNPHGIPKTFIKQTISGVSCPVNKGSLSKFRLYPKIRDEYMEESGDVVSTITASNIVGQIFKASYDNINTLELTIESNAAVTELDYVEGYATDAALQAAWVGSGVFAVRESTIISPNNSSTQSMKISLDENGDEWVKTIASTDYVESVFELDFYQTKDYNKAKVSFFIGDGTNTKSITLAVSEKDTWQNFTLPEEAMVEDGVGTTNSAAITKIGFRIEDKDGDEYAYVDNILVRPKPGHVDIKLWDMGAILPTSGTTKLTDGAQYTQLTYNKNVSVIRFDLLPGKRRYSIRTFLAGLHGGTAITVDNYYALTLNYIDQEIKVYGDNGGNNFYTSGYGFTATSESVAITTLGAGKDCFFSTFHTQDVYFTNVKITTHGIAGGPASEVTVLLESPGEIINETIITNVPVATELFIEANLRQIPAKLPNKGKLEVYYNDDETDNIEEVNVTATYIHEPASPNL